MRTLFAGFILAAAFVAPAMAQQPARMEVGVGAAALMTPTYRGSGNYDVQALPFPYFVYRGDRLKLTRQNVRLQALDWEHFSLGISGSGSFPGDGGRDPARAGMPDLDPTLEIGPSLDWTWTGLGSTVCFCVPIRSVTATDLKHWQGAGWVAHPQVRWSTYAGGDSWILWLSSSIGPLFADRRNHAYFYDVEPQYAQPGRGEYHAGGGYSGTRASIFASFRRDRWTVGAGLVGDWLEGAAFSESPLLQKSSSAILGVSVAYSLWRTGYAADEAPETE